MSYTPTGERLGALEDWYQNSFTEPIPKIANWYQNSYESRSQNSFVKPVMPAAMGQYSHPHTRAWAETIDSFDGYVFVTPEYNHSTSGALKNAIDFLYAEWNNKAAGFVSYGAPAAPARWNTYGWCWASSRSPTCAPRSRCRCTPTSSTSAS